MHLTALASAAEVLAATGQDPFARSSLRRRSAHGWAGDGATAWLGVDPDEGTPYVSTVGPPARVAALLAVLVPQLPPDPRVTVPRGTPDHLPAGLLLRGTDWDLRWLASPPPLQPGEERVLPVEDDPAVLELLTASSPTASAQPGDPAVRRWVGVRDERGVLLACAADTSGSTRVGHLSSIAVRPDARGQGLGRTVTAALARLLLADGKDLITLGMYADNTRARAVYDALGFADDHRCTSGLLRAAVRSTG